MFLTNLLLKKVNKPLHNIKLTFLIKKNSILQVPFRLQLSFYSNKILCVGWEGNKISSYLREKDYIFLQ